MRLQDCFSASPPTIIPADRLKIENAPPSEDRLAIALMELDEFRLKLQELGSTALSNRNEATTRLQLIDTLLYEILGWSKADTVAEHPFEGEYADYILSAPRPMVVWEAKREGKYFDLPSGVKGNVQSLASLRRINNTDLNAALDQAAAYCYQRGIPVAVVCNGHHLVAFLAVRLDGVPPHEGKCLIFVSFEHMLDNFELLWNCLSRPGTEEKQLSIHLAGPSAILPPQKLSASIHGYPRVGRRNEFQANMQSLSYIVLEQVSHERDLEKRFIEECYIQSGTLSQHSLLSRNILLTRYNAIFDEGEMGPTLSTARTTSGINPDLLSLSLSNAPVLLLGDVGVGKTAFIRNLMIKEAPEEIKNAIALYIDLGTSGTLASSLRDFMLREVEEQLRSGYGIDLTERNFVRGVYHGELLRLERSVVGELKQSAPHEYQSRVIERLESLISNRDEHIKHCLTHLAHSWKKQVVIFVDNADQRNDQIQQEAFLVSQEIANNWNASVYVAIRPETFHLSQRRGALSAYHTRAFTISPPRTDEVIEKRILFALRIATGAIPVTSSISQVQLYSENLKIFLRIMMDSLRLNPDLHQFIDNVASGNIREALDLVRIVLGSGHLNTRKILDIYEESRRYIIPLHEFTRAVIFEDYQDYDPDRSKVVNLFDIGTLDGREHFLMPMLIMVLAKLGEAPGRDGFAVNADVYANLQSVGFTPDQIDSSVVRGIRGKLLESSARRIPDSQDSSLGMLRCTAKGLYHVHHLIERFVYLDAVTVDTPIVDLNARVAIKDVTLIRQRVERAELMIKYLDSQWTRLADLNPPLDWSTITHRLKMDVWSVKSRNQ